MYRVVGIIHLWRNRISYGKIAEAINATREAKISKSAVWYTVRRFRKTGTVKNVEKSSWPQTARTPQLVNATREKIRRDPKRSMNKYLFYYIHFVWAATGGHCASSMASYKNKT